MSSGITGDVPAGRPSGMLDVSVVIAAWNAAAFIDTAIDSALSQEGVTLEVIVADDASTDETVEWVGRRAATDPRLRVLSTTVNGGPSVARNRAIAAARGEWIAILDSDDRFEAGRLARMQAFGSENAADIVFDLYSECDTEGQAIEDTLAVDLDEPERWDLSRWASDNQLYVGKSTGYLKPLIRRDFMLDHDIRYREALRNSEDYALIAELLAAGATLWVLPETGYFYTRRAGSLSHRVEPGHIRRLRDFERAFVKAVGPSSDPDQRKALAARLRSVENALALETLIDALKTHRLATALKAILGRPQAIPLVICWLREVLGKRIN